MTTVSISDTTPRVRYTVGGTPDASFDIPFPFFAEEDVHASVDGDELLASAFAISGVEVENGYSGGTLTLDVAVSNATVTIWRDIPIARTTDVSETGALPVRPLNTQLAKAFGILQQLEDADARALRGPVDDDPALDMALPAAAARASKYLGFDGTGQPVAIGGDTDTAVDLSDRMVLVSGASAAMTLAAIFARMAVTPEMFGIVADDDSAAAANTTKFATMAAAVRYWRLPDNKTYYISGLIDLHSSGLAGHVIEGSRSSVIRCIADGHHLIRASAGSRFRGFKLQGAWTSGAHGAGFGGIRVFGVGDVLIEDVETAALHGDSVRIEDGDDITIRGCKFRSKRNGISLVDNSVGSSNIRILDTDIREFTVGGIQVEKDDATYVVQDVWVEGNKIVGPGAATASSCGVAFTKSAATNASNFKKYRRIYIGENTVSDVDTAFVVRGADRVKIHKNTAFDVNKGLDAAQGNTVSRLDVVGNNFDCAAWCVSVFAGHASENTSAVRVESNRLEGTASSQTALLLYSAESHVADNTFIGGQIGVRFISANTDQFECVSNRFRNQVAIAIYVDGGASIVGVISVNSIHGEGATVPTGISYAGTSNNVSMDGNNIGVGVATPITDTNNAARIGPSNIGYSPRSTVNLTADAQAVTVGTRTWLALNSNDATATNRTFTLSNGVYAGQELLLEVTANACELADSGNCLLSAAWQPDTGDTLSLRWNGSAWVERSRSAN